MKVNLSKLDKKVLAILQQTGQAADRQGLTAYVVGGFVRDIFLKRKNFDVDIVVEGDAMVFAQSLAKGQKAEVKIYKEFGTATLVYLDGLRVDFATARKEIYQRSGALPTVSPGSIRDDLFRRDFTINALAAVVNKSRFGELVDLFEGLKDLEKRQVRVLHSKSFMDDPTRILRAVRFEQRFNFKIEPQTLSLLASAIENGCVRQVTLSRYFEEFKKILKEPFPVKSIKRLHGLRGLDFLSERLSPDFAVLALIERNILQLKKNVLYKSYPDWWLAYLMGIVESWPASQLGTHLEPLNLTRLEKASLLECPQSGTVIDQLKKRNLKPRQVYDLLDGLPRPIIYFIRARTSVNIVAHYVDSFLKFHSKVKLSITGEDLKRLGIPEGKMMGQVIRELLLRKIDGKIASPAKELQEVNQVKIMIQGRE